MTNRRSTLVCILHSALCILFLACSHPEGPAKTTDAATDTREPMAVEYVKGSELAIHAKPDDASAVVTKYQASEAVSILSRQGDWVEVRTAFGSGWAKAGELATGGEMTASSAGGDNNAPRFIVPPEPVSQPGAAGELVLEADVSSNGDVVSLLARNF